MSSSKHLIQLRNAIDDLINGALVKGQGATISTEKILEEVKRQLPMKIQAAETDLKDIALMRSKLEADALPLAVFVQSTARSVHRVKGTSVFLSAARDGVPPALLHNLKHNQVLHENVILLTVAIAEMPRIAAKDRIEHAAVGCGFHRIVLHYGFMDEVDIPRDLANATGLGIAIEPMRTSYFLGREKLIAAREVAGMALWRERLFAWMLQASESAMDYYRLPANRVVELGSQLRI